jgi:hypothetical protein
VEGRWFTTRLDYAAFVQDAERVFGEGSVSIARYESGDIVQQARDVLGVDDGVLPSAGDRNKALSVLGVELLRRLNSLGIPGERRNRIAAEIIELDRTLGATSEPLRPSEELSAKVLAITRESEAYLARRFGIGWADVR